mmetsp:Transcript_64105/g.164968  ORF Transcript_64105/g.164968 Transcript_64105/m.164968 type:complete len:331 (-) Transcript_64105:519-1511(-)
MDVVNATRLVLLAIGRKQLDVIHGVAPVAQRLVRERALQLGRLLHAQRARDKPEGRVVQPRALVVQLLIASQADVVLALQTEAEGTGAAVHALEVAVGEALQVKLLLLLDLVLPVVLHLLMLLHVPLQDLRAGHDVWEVHVLPLAVAAREDLQLRLEVAYGGPVHLDIIAEDFGQATKILGRDQGLQIVLRLYTRGLVTPQEAVDPHLHHLLWVALGNRLPAELPQLSEVVVEGMLPGDLPGVRADVADNAANAFVTRPRLRELCLSEGLDQPLQVSVHRVDADVVGPLVERWRCVFAQQSWEFLQLEHGLLSDSVVNSEEDEGVGIQLL